MGLIPPNGGWTVNRRQLAAFALLLVTNALLAYLTYTLGLTDPFFAGQEMPPELANTPPWLVGLANAGMILVLYGLLGLLGLWFARRLGWPGVYHPDAGWRRWLWWPMALGLVVGVLMVIGDRIFSALGDWGGFSHPTFPMSLIASATAGIGEEIIFRVFVMGLWAFLLQLLFRQSKGLVLWIANGISALAFATGHLPAAMYLLGTSSPLELPALLLAEMVLLNGLVALVAGERYARDGLVAAAGVHFWADVVWHVVWPLLGL
jgi:hypothetical protein